MLPEVCNMIEPDRAALRQKVMFEDQDSVVLRLREAAAAQGVWVLIGSVVVKSADDDGKLRNRSILIDDTGNVRARYDKMHLFDVNVGAKDTYRESDTYVSGTEVTVAETPWGRLGMTVCYDLRFPHLYRDLARAGCRMLTVPSAFTRPTGAAHWHVLLRARAIECGAVVLAPAQTGVHAGGRETFGHSLVVGPWGEVLADGGEETGLVMVDLDFSVVADARRKVPSLQHDRDYDLEVTV